MGEITTDPLTRDEVKGLWAALGATLVLTALLLLATVPEWGVLRNPETGDLLDSAFLRGS
jgi:aminobenzoyl-glutamate transport protein